MNKKPPASAAQYTQTFEPVLSSALSTDDQGLCCGHTTLPSQGQPLPVYFARPDDTSAALPVVLVIQEVFGVHAHIQDICRRLAKQGYLAIAPELFFRQGDPHASPSITELISQIVSQVPDRQVLVDLDHTAHWAIQQQGGDPQRLALTGFCWGGRITWLYAAHNPQLKAAVAWYGRLEGESTLLCPTHPIQCVSRLSAPVLGLYAGHDHLIPVSSVDNMRQALQQENSASEIEIFQDAEHAFFADYRPSYHPASAEAGWQKMLDWFKKYGV